jgi:uncharacterized protein YkwD
MLLGLHSIRLPCLGLGLVMLACAAGLAGCGGGGITNNELPGIGQNPIGGDDKHPFAFTPPVEYPPVESYADHAPSTAGAQTRWLVNAYMPLPGAVYQNASLGTWADQILSRINTARTGAGLAVLRPEPHMNRIAQAHARDMALRKYFNHDTPEGLEPWDRMAAADIPPYDLAAENIAKGQETVDEVVEGWLQSPGHRANLLNPDFNYIGIGLYFDDANYRDPVHAVVDLVDFYDDPSEGGYWMPDILTP